MYHTVNLHLHRDALTKMRDVYTKNPALGDPNTTDKELAIIGKKLDAMRLELQKYQVSFLCVAIIESIGNETSIWN